ncbi:MAG: hypothetical protein IH623_12085 [Verrucomicrobia bacterium]|nr:hypothetical protein [Verrucomicrobiota bacterium]
MTGYTKLFSSIVGSTIWTENDRTRIVWITMLALANQHGEVEASIPGLAKFASVPVPDTEKALTTLSSPDPYSRSKEFEGRRIQAIDGGWVILNHAKYRSRASADDRREQDRIRQQRNRQAKRVTKTSATVTHPSATVTQSHDKQSQSQKSESDADAGTFPKTGAGAPSHLSRPESVKVVIDTALRQGGYKASDITSWLMAFDCHQTAKQILADAAAEFEDPSPVNVALRFIRYNNSQGWKVKSWKGALNGFKDTTANLGASDVPMDWVPSIETKSADGGLRD